MLLASVVRVAAAGSTGEGDGRFCIFCLFSLPQHICSKPLVFPSSRLPRLSRLPSSASTILTSLHIALLSAARPAGGCPPRPSGFCLCWLLICRLAKRPVAPCRLLARALFFVFPQRVRSSPSSLLSRAHCCQYSRGRRRLVRAGHPFRFGLLAWLGFFYIRACGAETHWTNRIRLNRLGTSSSHFLRSS